MNVYISVDMEGIAGVNHPRPTERDDAVGYRRAVELMVGETNAAIEGALDAGGTDVLVNDSHGGMFNLTAIDLHPAARLLQGQKPWSMVAGAGPSGDGATAGLPAGIGAFADGSAADVALFVGYHARAGHPRGTIAHTYSYRPTRTLLDGRPTGEYGINAIVLGQWGVPVGLVAGDDALADEVAEWLPWAERVVVKTATGWASAASLHPDRARALIRDAAARAVRRATAGELRPLVVGPPVVIEADYSRAIEADYAAIVPGVERVGDRGIRVEAPDAVTAYRAFLAGLRLSSLAD
jgi:D-amino peptidase